MSLHEVRLNIYQLRPNISNRVLMKALLILFSTKLIFLKSLEAYPSLQTSCITEIIHRNQGVITSPGYPHGYSAQMSCTSTIKSSPNQTIAISFQDIDIEETGECDSHPCCEFNWLRVGTVRNNSVKNFCGNNLIPSPYVSHENEIWIKFHISSAARGGRGFKLAYVIGNPFKEFCNKNEFRCENKHCIPKAFVCNGHSECGDGSDERNCKVDKCLGKIQCLSGKGCFLPEEHCNGIPQCSDSSDERLCTPDLCTSERGGFLCSNLKCIRESWRCDQTNDCEDNSDEAFCLKNSVITAAVMGSLICGLLLVIAIGCTCKLYALRLQDQRDSQCTGLTQIEQEFLHREPPPPYAVAVNTPSAHYFSQTRIGFADIHYGSRGRPSRRIRRLRRSRRRPPTPPPQTLTPINEGVNNSSSLETRDSTTALCNLQMENFPQEISQPNCSNNNLVFTELNCEGSSYQDNCSSADKGDTKAPTYLTALHEPQLVRSQIHCTENCPPGEEIGASSSSNSTLDYDFDPQSIQVRIIHPSMESLLSAGSQDDQTPLLPMTHIKC